MNAETESTMGLNWLYEYKMDVSNLRAIHNKYGSRPLKTYPYYSYFDQFVIFSIKKVNTLSNISAISLIKFLSLLHVS